MKHRTYAGCVVVALLSTTAFSLAALAYDQPFSNQYDQNGQAIMRYDTQNSDNSNPMPTFGMPKPMQAGNVMYVSGGIGEGNREAMESMKGDYNVHVLSAAKSGAFTGDTYIVISDAKTQDVLLNVASGPIFYANLPKGRYVVDASSSGQSMQKTITVTGKKPVNLRFAWQDEPGTMITPAE